MNRATAGFQLMYLGAFTALEIQNVGAAKMLAEATADEAEAVHAIGILRDGKDGDRVWPALEWLRAQRDTPQAAAGGGRR